MKKLSRRQITIIAVVALVLVACMISRSKKGNETDGLDAAARQACDDFAAGYPKADDKTGRLALADKVTASSGKSDNRDIQEKAAAMGNAAGDGGTAWTSAATALEDACRNAGWKG